jgi:adenylylsulfate kinase
VGNKIFGENMTGVEVHWHEHVVTRQERELLNRNKGCVIWFTGLSASGKSTIANLVDLKLYQLGRRSFVLDGDNVRHGLNASPNILNKSHSEEFSQRFGLGFSAEDREENIRRIGAVAGLFVEAGVIAITAFISPYRADRDRVRQSLSGGNGDFSESFGESFIEVFVDTPIEICEQRDPKGLYKKARAGQLTGFTGIDAPYEKPNQPEITLDGKKNIQELADEVINYLTKKQFILE